MNQHPISKHILVILLRVLLDRVPSNTLVGTRHIVQRERVFGTPQHCLDRHVGFAHYVRFQGAQAVL